MTQLKLALQYFKGEVMSKNKDEQERTLLLNRLLERKDMILQASKEIEGLKVEYIAKGGKDPDGRIESEVVKRLLTIFSCLAELGGSRFFLRNIGDIPYIAIRRDINRGISKRAKDGEGIHIVEMSSTALICAMANLLEFHWDFKKGPVLNIEQLESFIKANLSLFNIRT